MKIRQVLPCLAYGDAIGNDTLALNAAIKEMGYSTEIFAEAVDQRLPKGTAKTMEAWTKLDDNDIIIYHLAIGWKYIDYIKREKCKKIAIYHNVTPPEFYRGYDDLAFKGCLNGIKEVKSLNQEFDYCLADSNFNKQELINYGYTCKIDVLPILIAFDDYKKKPADTVLKKYKGKGSNIVFVGRIVPNKKHEDIIKAFYYYKKYYDNNARLFLVGSYSEDNLYYRRLKKYIELLKLDDVIFPGHIKFNEILGYYSIADVFLCMSEHEGFCVPLVEAMMFDVPILAYDSCAISGTLGDSGITFENKSYIEVAGLMDRIVKDPELKKCIVKGQQKRLEFFEREKVQRMFQQYLKDFIGE